VNIPTIKKTIKKLLGIPNIDIRGFDYGGEPDVHSHALSVANRIRGAGRDSAVIIHGVAPRSGTVYVGELLKLHPDFSAYPNNMWEIPFLETTGDLKDAQSHFFRAYKQNQERMGPDDFMPLFGSSLLAYLHSYVPEGKRMLLKIPDVRHLDCFYAVFPQEYPLLLLRDGRDLVASTIKTWPKDDFSDVCRLWDYGAKMILAFGQYYKNSERKFLIVKYENILDSPESFVKSVCNEFGLDPHYYPFDDIVDVSVRGSSRAAQKDGGVTWDAQKKPSNFNPVGHWLDWSDYQKRVFKEIAGQSLIDTGYCENNDW